ncbi:MAG TPA: hypothetical protein VL379_13315, partial [Pseudomonadales bacterium]|nr:hypothetical protein [Pseudomonadales bacterium]
EFATQAAGADFSPSPPAGAGTSLCWEANVISFVRPSTSTVLGSNLFGSANRTDVTTDKQSGWGDLTFRAGAVNVATGGVVGYDPQTGLTFTPSTTFSGLPVIGFAAQSFVNGTLTDTSGALIRSTYGASWGHRYIGPQFGILP